MKILIKQGRVIDPANNLDKVSDILVVGQKIANVSESIKDAVDKVIDARGMIVMPAVFDMHVHLREPGREDKETIASGSRAALRGGVASVLAMPNTEPAMDRPERIKTLKEIVEKSAKANVFISAAISEERQGNKLCDIAALRKLGVIAITDDGSSVDDDKLMEEALKRAKKENVLVVCHCEDKKLCRGGVVNLGFTSTRLGLRGISNESEYSRVARDIALAKKTKARIHIAHVSCKESVALIAKAKKEGVGISCETAPHYFSLTEQALCDYDTNTKMNPPLRSKKDMLAIQEGLAEGIIDVIASDHAPHTENEKDIEFDRAEFGVIGLETILAVAITELIGKKVLDWSQLVGKLSYNPAKILGIKKGTLSKGGDADIVIVSPDKEWVVKKEELLSKSKNSCFLGKKLKGMVEYTLCLGKIAYKATALNLL